jgi:predicted phage baseplate assembly protein
LTNDAYLRTAQQRAAVARLVSLIGYRPRPALGGFGKVAALSTAKLPIKVPLGLGIQSKPAPGKKPQVFQVDADTMIAAGGALAVEPAIDTGLDPSSVLLKGAISGVKPGDKLMLVHEDWKQGSPAYAWVTVDRITQEKDPRGKPNTRITWDTKIDITKFPTGTKAKDCQLFRSTRTAQLFQASVATTIVAEEASHPIFAILLVLDPRLHLAALARDVAVGDRLVVTAPKATGTGAWLVQIVEYAEYTWYSNATTDDDLRNGEFWDPNPVPHSVLSYEHSSLSPALSATDVPNVRVHYGLTSVGEIIDTPATSITSSSLTLISTAGAPEGLAVGSDAFLEDATGAGCAVKVKAISTPATGGPATITCEGINTALRPPLRLLYNVLSVSEGQSVADEILGSGDATRGGQSFTLQKSPVAYMAGAAPGSSLPFHSTVKVRVGGVEWSEVDSFVDQPKGARVFVTFEDADGKTHVLFGDGVNGARLPTGENNVVASYRHGAGHDAPGAAALTTLLQSIPGLSGVRSPVAMNGGADAEPPDQMRRYAPLSTFAFGRAISLADYEAIAVTAGAKRAQAIYSYDAARQKALVKVYVDDAAAAAQAKSALTLAVDPSVPFEVQAVKPDAVSLEVTLRTDEAFDTEAVRQGVRDALLAPESELFGAAAPIGGAIYESQIAAVCMSVAGVLEVTGIKLSVASEAQAAAQPGNQSIMYRSNTQRARFAKTILYQTKILEPASVNTVVTSSFRRVSTPTAERHSPGEGAVFALEDKNLVIVIEGGGDGIG